MITLITGSRNTGKTTWLEHKIICLEGVGGILSPKRFEYSNFVGYDVYDVMTSKTLPFLRYCPDYPSEEEKSTGNWIGPFLLEQDGLAFAREAMENAMKSCRTIVLDEVGMAELEGRVFHDTLMKCIEWHDHHVGSNLYIVVQEKALPLLLKDFKSLEYAETITIMRN